MDENCWYDKCMPDFEVSKLKYVSDIITGNTPSKLNESFYENGIIDWVKPNNITDDYRLLKSKDKLSIKGVRKARVVPRNSTLVCAIGTIGKLALSEEEVTTNQQINSVIFTKINKKYGFYILVCMENEFKKYSNKVVVSILNKTSMENLKIISPSPIRQERICLFLDSKLSEIDFLISSKEKQIKLLEEQRQAMITEAVTKGLNSSVRMKDSGVEWIGEIPEHWEIAKIKYTTYVKGRIGWQGLRSDEFIDDGPYLVTGTNFKNGIVDWQDCYHISEERYNEAVPIQLKEDDLLITKDGTIGKLALVKEMPGKTILNSGIFVTRPLANKYINNYLYWNLNSASFSQYIRTMETGSTIKHLYQETFVNYSYALPSLEEQESISCYLNNKNQKLGNVIQNITIQISKLKEYRHSLIHEAVTGKIAIEEMESYLKEVDKDDN